MALQAYQGQAQGDRLRGYLRSESVMSWLSYDYALFYAVITGWSLVGVWMIRKIRSIDRQIYLLRH